MTSIPFDTHDAVKTLRNAGVDERAAEAMVQVMARTTDLPKIEHLATKTDLEAAVAKLEARILWTVVGMGGAITVANILLKTLGIT